MEQKRVAIKVNGSVQGVGFRYFTRDTARELGLSGWVRNRFDGSVEVEAQGPQERISMFIDELQEGPALAHVTNFTVDDIPLLLHEKGFLITH